MPIKAIKGTGRKRWPGFFGEIRTGWRAARLREESFVRLATFGDSAAAVIDYEDAFETDVWADLFEDVEQHLVDNQNTVLSVVNDIGQFFRVQPQVQGMSHGPGRSHAEISFEVLVLVPH